MNHKHHHLVDVSGDNERKTELFNQGEKLKLQISKNQFNILTGEDDTNCILNCPYKDLFKSAVILMPSEVRRTFAEQWGEMEEAVDMVEEVEREEREDMEREENLTREPDTDEESEEEDGQSDGNENLIDPYDYWSPRTRAQYERDMEEMAREAVEEQHENDSVLEEMRWVAREHSD